jgi:hypothetical protein
LPGERRMGGADVLNRIMQPTGGEKLGVGDARLSKQSGDVDQMIDIGLRVNAFADVAGESLSGPAGDGVRQCVVLRRGPGLGLVNKTRQRVPKRIAGERPGVDLLIVMVFVIVPPYPALARLDDTLVLVMRNDIDDISVFTDLFAIETWRASHLELKFISL